MPTASSDDSFTYNLRFPGQYFDSETGLHHNYHRDYDSRLGRYIESDPIGLKGGLATFAYAKSSPLGHIDPFGLYTYEPPRPNLNTVVCDGNGDNPVPQLGNMNGSLNMKCLGPCVIAHEQNHIRDLLKIGSSPCRGRPKGTVVKFDTNAQNNQSERDSYNVEIDCLMKTLGSSSSCDCNTIVEKRIRQLFDERKKYE